MLRGQGREQGLIRYDIIEPPGEAVGGPARADSYLFDSPLLASDDPTSGPTLTGVPAERVSASIKGSLLVYPKVEIRWDADGNVTQDTFITLLNDSPSDVAVQLYFVNGDPPEPPEEEVP